MRVHDTVQNDPIAILIPERVDDVCREAIEQNNSEEACTAFIKCVREGPLRIDRAQTRTARDRQERGKSEYLNRQRAIADDALQLRYTGVYGVVHHFEQEIDWHQDPTAEEGEKQTNEWTWQFNRHLHWVALAETWEYTGDAKYARAWEQELWSWIEQCPRPSHGGREPRSAWRPIETAIRAGWRWPIIFEIFRKCPDVSDEALWAFIVSFREHGRHLLEHPEGNHNMQAMICNGLSHVGFMFPELVLADTFALTAVDRSIGQLERQIYPDGLEDELAPGYGGISFRNLYDALKLSSWASDDEATVPPRAWERAGDIIEAFGKLAAPDGRVPAIHDSGEIDITPWYAELERDLDPERFGERPWRSGKSHLLPWGGFAVLRDEREGYALLDAGPKGTCHAHADAQQVLIKAGEQWLVSDPGKPRYDASPISRHLRSAAAHNVVLMDDAVHTSDPAVPRAKKPFPIAYAFETPVQFAIAQRSAKLMEYPEQKFAHERALFSINQVGWLVFDRLIPSDEKSHTWHWLWHSPADQLQADMEGASGYYDTDGSEMSFRMMVNGANAVDTAVLCGEYEERTRGWQTKSGTSEPSPMSTLEVVMEGAQPWLFTLFTLNPDAALDVHEEHGGYAAKIRSGDTHGRLHVTGGEEITTVCWEGDQQESVTQSVGPHTR